MGLETATCSIKEKKNLYRSFEEAKFWDPQSFKTAILAQFMQLFPGSELSHPSSLRARSLRVAADSQYYYLLHKSLSKMRGLKAKLYYILLYFCIKYYSPPVTGPLS